MTKELKRTYLMTDSELCMFVSNLVATITRDQVLFTARGIDAIAVGALETLGDAYEIFPPDSFYQADVSIAVENKNVTREALIISIRDVVQCAVIKWGEGSPQYKKFGAQKMTSTGDKQFLTLCRQVVTTATAYLSELTASGLVQSMIDAVSTDAQTFEDNMNAINDAIEQRDIKKIERIQDGNEIYSYVTQYCTIGKVIFDDVDEAKYNDYVIYPKSTTLPGKPLNLNYDVLQFNLHWDASPNSLTYEVEFKSALPGFDWAVCYSGAALLCNHNPGVGNWLYRVRGHNDEGYGTWSDELAVLIPA